MDPEMVTRTIQLIIAPVVMITSCCILGSGLLAHYSSLGERLRFTIREGLELKRKPELASLSSLTEFMDAQLSALLHRHKLVRTSLVCVLLAIVFFIVDMFMIAFSVVLNKPGLSGAVLILFLAGVASLLACALYAVFDVYLSHNIFTYETTQVISMNRSSGKKP